MTRPKLTNVSDLLVYELALAHGADKRQAAREAAVQERYLPRYTNVQAWIRKRIDERITSNGGRR